MSFFRRILIALVLGCTGAAILSFGLLGLSAVPGFQGFQKHVLPNFGWIPEAARTLPWSGWTSVSVGLLLALACWKLTRSIDFFLFSPFDRNALEAVPHYTGMLAWHLPEEGELTDTWNTLLAWVRRDAGDGRWSPRWLWDDPQVPVPFSWTVLLGSNGTGKTQLARELARCLAQRDQFGSSRPPAGFTESLRRRRSQVALWWRRVAWIRSDNVPWDAGAVATSGGRRDEDRLARLREWLPRAPTLLLLDDPASGLCSEVLEVLESRRRKFWYPVRLLIVDQFVPPDLPILKDTDRPGWHHRDSAGTPFKPLVMPLVRFDGPLFRKALGGGFWRGVDAGETLVLERKGVPQLRRDEDFLRLATAVEGSPLLLALAVYWLWSKRKPLDHLLSDDVSLLEDEERELFERQGSAELRDLVAHRLVRDRLEELYDGLRCVESPNGSATRESIACATIASGIPRLEAARRFGLALDDTELHRLFPYVPGLIETLPPLRPWLLGERFVLKVARDVFRVRGAEHPGNSQLGALIQAAWESNPGGTLKALSRPGRLPAQIASTLRELPKPADQHERVRLFSALATRCLFESRDVLEHGLEFARDLDSLRARAALSELDRLVFDRIAHPGAHAALYCALLTKALDAPGQFATLWSAFCPRLMELLDRCSKKDDELVHLGARRFARVAIGQLVATHPDDPLTELLSFDTEIVRRLYARSTKEFANATADEESLLSPELSEILGRLWRLRSLASNFNVSDSEALAEEVVAGARAMGVSSTHATLIAATAWQVVVRVRCQVAEHKARTEEAAYTVDRIAKPFPDNARIQWERAEAWRHVAFARSQLPEQRSLAEAAACTVDEVAKPFPDDARIQGERAIAWSCVAFARSQLPEQRSLAEAAAYTVDEVAKPFPDDASIQGERAIAWRCVAFARSQLPEQRSITEAAAHIVDEVAKPFRGDARIQGERARAWRHVAFARSQLPEQRSLVEAAARIVDEVAKPFPDDASIQGERAEAWRRVAFARSQLPEQRSLVEAAARIVDHVAKPFPDNARIQEERARAWLCAAEVRLSEGDKHNAVRALDYVAEISQRFKGPGRSAFLELAGYANRLRRLL